MADLRAQFQGMADQLNGGQMAPPPDVEPTPATGEVASEDLPPRAAPATELVQFGTVKVDATIADRAAELMGQFPSLKPTSGHRDEQQNKREHGVDRSWHLKGKAVDFKGSAKEMYEAAAAAKQAGAVEALVHNGGDGTILHVAWSE